MAKAGNVQKIAVAAIRNFDEKSNLSTQSRAVVSHAIVKEYAEAITEGAVFPAIKVFFDGTDYWLSDGWHRLEANKTLGFKEIEAEVLKGGSREALLSSLGANELHGLRRSNLDKQNAVELAFRLMQKDSENWSDARIAEMCNVSAMFVGNKRKLMGLDSEGKRVGKDGKEYTAGGTVRAAAAKAKSDAEKDAGYASASATQGPVDDANGVEVPEHLRVVFGVLRSTLIGKIKGMKDLRKEIGGVIALLPLEPETTPLKYGDKEIGKDLSSAFADFASNVIPHAVCPYCKGAKAKAEGSNCRACNGAGWLAKAPYNEAPDLVKKSIQTADEMGYWAEVDRVAAAEEAKDKAVAQQRIADREKKAAEKKAAEKVEGAGKNEPDAKPAKSKGLTTVPKPTNGSAAKSKSKVPPTDPAPVSDLPF